MDYLSLIRGRISTRTYSDQIPPEQTLGELLDFANSQVGPFGHRPRFAWVRRPDSDRGEARSLGTYGMIRGAQIYLVGAISQGDGAIEDYGYVFEKVILKATSLGLATCWLGGTFQRTGFADKIGLRSDEWLPAITPVGHASAHPRLKDRLVIAVAGARSRKPLTDLVLGDASAWGPALEAVQWGPSASNKQPWRMAVDHDGQRIHFYLEETPGYNDASISRCGFPIQTLDLGIAWCHFDLALADQGVQGVWTKDDPGLKVSPLWKYSATWKTQDARLTR